MNTVTTMNTAVKTASVSLVVDNTKPLTMSSRQIAEFTDKKHSNVMRDIREMYESLGIIDQLKTEFVERINNLGYAVKEPVYHLDEEMTLTLVTGYDVKRRMIVIQEWKRLKEENEKLRQERLAVNPYADFEETDWIELALKKTRENKKLIELHVRKSVDSHSMTRLFSVKTGRATASSFSSHSHFLQIKVNVHLYLEDLHFIGKSSPSSILIKNSALIPYFFNRE